MTLTELRESVWSERLADNKNAVSNAVCHLRTALGQKRGEAYPIETVSQRGYRFAAPPPHERMLWRDYAKAAASSGVRTAAQCIEVADELVRAERGRFGAL